MELDFSEKIKELLKSKDLATADSIIIAEDKTEKICSECKKPMSECECEEEDEGKDESEDSEEEGEMEEDEAKSRKKNKIVAFLMKKVSAHNGRNNPFLVSLDQLMKVYARGLEESTKTFRPGKSEDEWAFARVNLFLKMASGQNVRASYAKADSDILNNQDLSENYEFSDFQDIEFQLAKLCCIEAGFSDSEFDLSSAEDKKKSKTLNKPFRLPSGSKKKFGVYVKNDKGNVVMVKFGDPNMSIKRDDPDRRKAYRSRHGCDNPGPKWKANYWSCKMWSKTPVSKITSSEECECGCEETDIQDLIDIEGAKKGLWDNIREKKKRMGKKYKPAKPGDKDRPDPEAWKKAQADEYEWDGEEEFLQEELLKLDPSLANVEEVDN
jgi:hypothetical protein